MKKAFTLIELLVVILIIGILAAIALPQYKTAVAKTRFLQVVTTARNLAEAQKRYYLANNTYTKNLDDLDIEIPGNRLEDRPSNIYLKNGDLCSINYNGEEQAVPWVGCEMKKPFTYYSLNYQTGRQACYSYERDNYAADQLCRNFLGGEMTGIKTHMWHSD